MPECYLDTIGGQPLFVIERLIAWCFPKMIGELVAECGGFNGFTRRILPGAQPPAGAQVRKGGVRYAKKVRDVLYECSSDPVRDIEAFVRLLVVNAVLGNCDGTSRTSPCFGAPTGRRLHWRLCTTSSRRWYMGGLDRHMAMRIGSTNKIDEVDRDDFLALAKELDVSPRMVRRLIGEVCEGAGGRRVPWRATWRTPWARHFRNYGD